MNQNTKSSPLDTLEKKNKYQQKKSYSQSLSPFEKAYIFWYIEMLKPPDQRNQEVLNAKYAFARGTTKK